MAEMQHEMAQEKGVMVEDEWGREWELLTKPLYRLVFEQVKNGFLDAPLGLVLG